MGLTQEKLASQIGVTSQAVSRWESETGMPDISLIVPLAQVLQVSTDTLFGMNQTNQDETMYMGIRSIYEKIDQETESPADAAKKQCDYILGLLEENPANYVYGVCFAERVANLSRYVDFNDYAKDEWKSYRKKAIQCGTQVIRFCQQGEWIERAHFALAWIYIHDRDFTSAKEHINTLPSVESNRLRESILVQV